MGVLAWFRGVVSSAGPDDEAAEREEFGVADRGETELQRDTRGGFVASESSRETRARRAARFCSVSQAGPLWSRGARCGQCSTRGVRVGRGPRGAEAAQRGARGRADASLLLRPRLVADLNERAVPPAGQGRRPRSGGHQAVRHLARLGVVTSRVGGNPRRRRTAPVRLERRRDARLRRLVRAARNERRPDAHGVPHT